MGLCSCESTSILHAPPGASSEPGIGPWIRLGGEQNMIIYCVPSFFHRICGPICVISCCVCLNHRNVRAYATKVMHVERVKL